MTKEKQWIERFLDHIEYDERQAKSSLVLRAFYKWVLELLRNCMVVAALVYLAQKSGYWSMYVVAGLSYFALNGYFYTYIEVWTLRVDFLGNTRTRMHLSILIGVLILNLTMVGIAAGLFATINKIVEVQGH